jgi:hypothetical protein
MENDRWSDGRLARPVSAPGVCQPGGDARRSISNIRNFYPAADSTPIEEALGIHYPGVRRSSLYLCLASTRAYLLCS